jgi:hypothetical protein
VTVIGTMTIFRSVSRAVSSTARNASSSPGLGAHLNLSTGDPLEADRPSNL